MTTASKIVSLDDLRPWRQAIAGRVVFTNGVFDLLHEGHVASLGAARQLGDALVVGLNSDASVRRLGKGPGRPVVPESGRARALAALAAVDRVVLFEEDTPRALIAAVRPDVLVKGADYAKSEIVGADLVESWGGEVHLTPLVPGISTTTILRSSHGSS